jgi:hypothetical protein
VNKIVAIDWDNQELRTAVALVGRRGVGSVTCTTMSWDRAEQQGLEAGAFEAVAFLLASCDLGHGRGILLARHQHLESLRLTAPPASDGELPILVENHLVTEIGGELEDTAHDYLALDSDPQSPRRVIITTMEASVAQQYRTLAAGLKLSKPRLCVRGMGAAFLARAQWAATEHTPDVPTLIVVSNVEEIDLVVSAANGVCYWRSVYCSPAGDSSSFRQFFADEVIRTLAVAEESLPEGQQIACAALFADDEQYAMLLQALRSSVELPIVQLTSAVPQVDVTDCEGGLPPGRFAPLIGALLQEAVHERPPVDLLNARPRERVPSSFRPAMLAVLAGLTALGLGSYVLWEEVAQEQTEVARLASQLKDLEGELKKVEPDAKAWEAIQAWNQAHVVWLDELRDLSLRFPPPGTAVALDFNASPAGSGRAVIRLNGRALDPTVVAGIDRALRDEYREILSRNLREQVTSPDDPFVWRFESLINTVRRPAADYREAFTVSNGEEALP